MKMLHLTLKKKWFDMIGSGEKKEEYREIKPYWNTRLNYGAIEGVHNPLYFFPKNYTHVAAYNGYGKNAPSIIWLCDGIRIGEGRPEWGAEPGVKYFILEIGDIIK